MQLLRAVISICLISSVLAFPSPLDILNGIRSAKHFIGPETRKQRLEAGWIDEAAKYFHEPGGDDILGHYDMRFFKGVVTHEERALTLQHMIRAYLNYFRDQRLETWIAHGTLLGWWWNGKILPWDWDIDTQVSGETLAYMATHLNQTHHKYTSPDRKVKREYLLDINPMSWERVRGDGMNIIDARWIDVHNGLYIDITGLSEVDPDNQPGIVKCKNEHRYRLRDLFPMRESMFEDVPARIPYAYDKLLIEEYETKALTFTEYEGHRWDPQERLWVRKQAVTAPASKGH